MPVNNQSHDESGHKSNTLNTRMAGIVKKFERAATRTGYTNLACSDQCLSLLRRQGINASQLVTNVIAAAISSALMTISPIISDMVPNLIISASCEI